MVAVVVVVAVVPDNYKLICFLSQEDDQANLKSFLKDALISLSSQDKDARCLYLACEKLR